MPISMHPSARYVTQSGIYDVVRLGPLTNRKITQYQKEGKYGELAKLRAQKQIKQKRQAKSESTLKRFNRLFSGI